MSRVSAQRVAKLFRDFLLQKMMLICNLLYNLYFKIFCDVNVKCVIKNKCVATHKKLKTLVYIIVFFLRICLSCDRRDEQPGLREQRQREWRRRNHSDRSSRNLVDGAHCDNAELYDRADPDGDVTFSFDVASPVRGLPFRRQHGVEQPHLRLRLHEVTQSYDGEFEAHCHIPYFRLVFRPDW